MTICALSGMVFFMGKNKRFSKGWLLFVILLPFFIIAFIIALSQVLLTWREYLSAEKEYDELQIYSPLTAETSIYSSDEPGDDNSEPEIDSASAATGGEDGDNIKLDPSLPLLELNEEYIGWIHIAGTNIDYPMVQTGDNNKYLRRTFLGEGNQSGTIFMDYRINAGFEAPFILIYGHNMHDGSMFAALEKFMDDDFMAANPEVTVSTINNEILNFRIFAVKTVNVEDKIFDLIGQDESVIRDYLDSINAPVNNGQLLILSTCYGSNNDERLLVLSTLE